MFNDVPLRNRKALSSIGHCTAISTLWFSTEYRIVIVPFWLSIHFHVHSSRIKDHVIRTISRNGVGHGILFSLYVALSGRYRPKF